MNHSPAKIGFLQALGIAVYVSLFAFAAWNIGEWGRASGIDMPEIAMMIIMLTVFIVSANICGSLILAYPIMLFMKGEKKEAYTAVAYAVGWLLVFLALFGIIAVSIS